MPKQPRHREVQLFRGDCLEVMPTLKDGSIDLTITSPPYDNLRTYNDSLNWGEHVWKPVLEELYRVTKKGGVIVWIVNDATINGSETGTSFKQALYAIECGFNLHDTMIWNKGSFSAVGSLKIRYASVFEYMFVFTKCRIVTFNPLRDRRNKGAGLYAKGTIRIPDGTMRKRSSSKVIPSHSQRFNVWNISPMRGATNHPAQFPESLVKDHIISWSDRGDKVLDPFMGSGTTGVACKRLGRKFVGIELEEEYFQIAKKRIEGIL